MRVGKELCIGEGEMRNLGGGSKNYIYFSFRVGWAKKMLRFIKNVFREIMMRFLAD